MKLVIGALLLSLVSAAPAAARSLDNNGKHGKKHRSDEAYYFPPGDVAVIRDYYAPRYRSLPPGLAKKYYRTGQLPPGWAKKMQPLPVVIERQLVVLPPDYRRGYIDGAVVTYSPRTRRIIDVVLPMIR